MDFMSTVTPEMCLECVVFASLKKGETFRKLLLHPTSGREAEGEKEEDTNHTQ